MNTLNAAVTLADIAKYEAAIRRAEKERLVISVIYYSYFTQVPRHAVALQAEDSGFYFHASGESLSEALEVAWKKYEEEKAKTKGVLGEVPRS